MNRCTRGRDEDQAKSYEVQRKVKKMTGKKYECEIKRRNMRKKRMK